MVSGYTHVPGHHRGATALRNLLAFHGIEISEEMAFGLGAGAGFYYLALDDTAPSRCSAGARRGSRTWRGPAGEMLAPPFGRFASATARGVAETERRLWAALAV